MTRFYVAVITDGSKTVRNLLAPYLTSNKDRIEFFDFTDQMIDEYEKGKRDFIFNEKDGKLLKWNDPSFIASVTSDTYTYPRGSRMVPIPFTVLYPDVYAFAWDTYHMDRYADDRIGVYENPQGYFSGYQEIITSVTWLDEYMGGPVVRKSEAVLHEMNMYRAMVNATDECFWAVITPDGEWNCVDGMSALSMMSGDALGCLRRWCMTFKQRFIDPLPDDCFIHAVCCYI